MMNQFRRVIRIIAAVILCISQQALIVLCAVLAYDSEPWIGYVVALLCIPMLYVNRLTFLYYRKYGIINMMTMNADTSELDVPEENRWYRQ